MALLPRGLSSPATPAISRRKQLERDVEHITQEMYQRNRELAETNQTLSLLQTINGLVLDSNEALAAVADRIALAIAESTGFPFVAILTAMNGSPTNLVVQGTNLKRDQTWRTLTGGRTMLGVDLRSVRQVDNRAKVFALNNYSDEQIAHMLGCTPELVAKMRGVLRLQSLYVEQLSSQGRLIGSIAVGFYGYADQVSTRDVTLLDRLSEAIGVALDNRLLFEENRRVLSQLKKSNSQLRALDATKDDFISMASHQLRTPLTSVKGYLSMVLEGDAGELNEQQRRLLQQSYNSSQQMVYLISDLLNLSRLKTGKFVIEPVPLNLAAVVQDEVGQLREIAKSRGVALEYHRPKHFPDLMLDETKLHQAVMNFMDNAIHYTPEGGTVTVNLRETPTAVEYVVQDTGIGVPKAEQHRLFTKFYRAENAQKARPDGTGLGLFMAKKVVVAQGGSILFESREGKGSTFGFRLPKAKLRVSGDEATQTGVESAASAEAQP